MFRNPLILVFQMTTSFLAPSVLAQQCDPSLLFKKDPVELNRGKEVEGQESIFIDHFRYRYQFASEENKAEFLKNPAKYEIQQGGSCARMGALSGPGSVGIHAVHEGKLYLFASEGCRKTFLARPEKVLETPDPVPATDDASTKKGRELLGKAVAAMGGAEALDRVRTLRLVQEGEDKNGNETVKTSETVTIEFPDRVRRDQTWGEYRYTFLASGDVGWYQGTSDGYPLHPQQCAALRRQSLARNPIAILKACNAPGAVIAYAGSGVVEEDGKKVMFEKVTVAFDGAATTLGIDPASGRIVTMEFLGQDSRLYLVPIEHHFTRYGMEGGLKVPMEYVVSYDGKPSAKGPVALASIRINDVVAPATFQKPES